MEHLLHHVIMPFFCGFMSIRAFIWTRELDSSFNSVNGYDSIVLLQRIIFGLCWLSGSLPCFYYTSFDLSRKPGVLSMTLMLSTCFISMGREVFTHWGGRKWGFYVSSCFVILRYCICLICFMLVYIYCLCAGWMRQLMSLLHKQTPNRQEGNIPMVWGWQRQPSSMI